MLPKRKKNLALLLFTLVVLLISSSDTFAVEFEYADNILISNIHIIDGDLYGWGGKITVNGTIKGDFIGGGKYVSINGQIDNSVDVVAEDFSHKGEINGSLRVFANGATIDGTVERSGLFFVNQLNVGKNAIFGKDIHFFGGNINIDGTVHGDVSIRAGGSNYGSSGIKTLNDGVYISGTIDGDLTIRADKIHIVAPALIKGDFKYISDNQANIDISSGVTILGSTTWDLPDKSDKKDEETIFLTTVKAGSKLLAAFLFGILLMVLGKTYVSSMVDQLQNRFAVSAAVGFISLAILVIFVLILIVAFILLLVGFSLIAENNAVGGTIILALSTIMIPISSVTIVLISSMIYSGKIVLALLIGYTIVRKFKSNPAYLSISQLFLGLLIVYILFALPYIGTLLFIIISIIGMGAIILGIKSCNKGLDKSKITDQVGI